MVTGAALGTGRAIALRLAAEGAIVVVADRDAEHGQGTVRAIEANGGRASFVKTDVTDDRDLRAMVAHAGEVGGGLHVLVNNAGGGGHVEPHFPAASPEQWGATLDLNLRGAMLYHPARRRADARRQQRRGVTVVSTAGRASPPISHRSTVRRRPA